MRVIAALSLAALAACGRAPAPQVAPAPIVPVEVSAIDEFGPVEGTIDAVAFWTHPTLAFNGLVLATGSDGVRAFNIEDGETVAADEAGGALKGLAVSYLGAGAAAQAYVATRRAGGDRGFRFYRIDNVSRALQLMETMFLSDAAGENAFCLGRDRGGERMMLHEMRDSGWRSRPLTIAGNLISTGEAQEGVRAGGFTACAVDDVDGAIYAATSGGDVFRIENNTLSASPLVRSGVASPKSIGVALNGLVAGGAADQCCGQIFVLDAAAGVIRLFDREDGADLGAVTLSASFDVDAVASATAMGVGYGNFGAIYRDGAIGLATVGEQAAIRLTPLNGVMDALSQPLGPTADPRNLAPESEDERLRIEVSPPVNP